MGTRGTAFNSEASEALLEVRNYCVKHISDYSAVNSPYAPPVIRMLENVAALTEALTDYYENPEQIERILKAAEHRQSLRLAARQNQAV